MSVRVIEQEFRNTAIELAPVATILHLTMMSEYLFPEHDRRTRTFEARPAAYPHHPCCTTVRVTVELPTDRKKAA